MNAEEKENSLEESSVTMVDVLQEEHELEEEYNAVLGASDEKCCTYSQGAIKRQALYSCLTCCPEARTDLNKCAGICLACSYRCHENHELVELYTKRNFRCDCPTEKISNQQCCLFDVGITMPQKCNSGNLYNQNFQGLYCKCHRPYPDPERTTEEVMLQCTVCEDWFHLFHLDMPGSTTKVANADICAEMICEKCMNKHVFLQDYTGLALEAPDNSDESVCNVTGNNSLNEDHDNKLRSDLDKSISDIMHMNAAEKVSLGGIMESQVKPSIGVEENTLNIGPEVKRQRIESDSPFKAGKKEDTCRRPKTKTNYIGGATFWGYDWRESLCQCVQCLALYKSEKVEYLLDPEDSAKSYEERGKKRGAMESTYEQGIRALASIGRVQQIDAITEYNRMKDKLKEFLQTFAVSKKVVTEADINRFFEEIRSEKNAELGQPFLCR